jgi:hypothetical protein
MSDNINAENLSNAMNIKAAAENVDNNRQDQTDTKAISSWLDTLPEDLRANKSLSKFTDMGSLAKSYLELEKNKGLVLPAEDASDEEWDKVYLRLGMPEDRKYISAEKRAELIKDNFADEDTLSAYEDLFAKSGLTKRQSNKALEQIIANIKSGNESYSKIQEKEMADNMAKINEKYGKDATEKMNILKGAMAKYGSEELSSLVKESNYAPVFVDLLIKLGELDKSDSLIAGQRQERARNKESAIKEIKALESNNEFMLKYKDKKHINHKDAVAQMKDLYDIAYSE